MKAEQKDALQKTEEEESIRFGKGGSSTGEQQRVPSVNMAPHRMYPTIEYLGKVQDMYVENCASKITKEKITSRKTKN